jgi:predicted P-loop ATPase
MIAQLISVKDIAAKLIGLGLSPLPIAPAQDAAAFPKKDRSGKILLNEDGSPKALFNGKNPSYLDANNQPKLINHCKYQNSQPSQDLIDLWWKNPKNGIGCLGTDDFIWIDIDSKNFLSQNECYIAFNMLVKNNPVLETAWTEKTQSGGFRIGVKLSEKKTFTNFGLSSHPGHIGEVLGAGRFAVLAPTVGVCGVYENINFPDEIPTIKSLESIGIFPIKKENEDIPNINYDEIPKIEKARKEVLISDCISAQSKAILDGCSEIKDKSLALTKAIKDIFGWENWLLDNGIDPLDNPLDLIFSGGVSLGFDGDRIIRIINSIPRHECAPAAKYRGGDEACQKKIKKILSDKKKLELSPILSEKEIEINKQSYQEVADKLGLKLNFHPESGDLIGDYVPKAIQLAMKLGDRLKFNEMSQNFELDGNEIDLNICQIILESEAGIEVGKDKAVDLISFVGKRLGSYHPVREYLKKLAIPDDSNIINNLASRYLGNHDPLANIYLKRTLIGAVQRVFQPGSKLDTMCILYGGQGIGKSSFWQELVSVLSGKNLFTDSLQDLSNKDELAKLRRFWGLELAEIDFLFSTKAKEQFKRFLSAPDDTYRPPYARANEVVPRTCFFTGTTNKKELLSDESGARRFWIIECLCDEIPINLLKEERDLIWAAAYKAYLEGEKCYLSKEEQLMSNESNKDYQDVDPWSGVIQSYLLENHFSYISTAGIYKNALQIGEERWDKKSSNRIGAIMRSLGWEYKSRREGAMNAKMWIAPQPAPQPVPQPAPQPAPQPVPQPAPQPAPQPTPQPAPQPAPQPTPQPAPQPTDLIPSDIADMEVEDIAGFVSELGGNRENIKFLADISFSLGMMKMNELKLNYPESFNILENARIEIYGA